jgi:TM2 domain-containing membrane protein YozV
MLDTQEQMLIEQKITNDGKNMVLAYVFWFFLGFFAAHRFYLKDGLAVVQLILNLLIIGLIWTLIDVFLIPGMVKNKNQELRLQFENELRMRKLEART